MCSGRASSFWSTRRVSHVTTPVISHEGGKDRIKTMIYKTLHRKQKIEQHELMCSGKVGVPAPLVEPVVLYNDFPHYLPFL
jgi:hypothetical protein